MDKIVKISDMQSKVRTFCEERDWDQYHNPKDLSIGIITEASELIEHFRFKSLEEMDSIMQDCHKRTEIAEELSDILFFILRFAQKYDFNLVDEFARKMSINEAKYPIEKSKGLNKKYSEV